MKKYVLVMIFALLFATTGYAQQQTEMVTVPKSSLTAEQTAELQARQLNQKVEMVSKYAGIGKEIGEGVNGALSAVNKNVAEFADTKVGKFTMFMVAWKILGTSVIQFLIGAPLWILSTLIIIVSYFKTCMPRRILQSVSADKTKHYQIVALDQHDYTTRAWAHFGAFVIASVLFAAVIFV